jgi:hypothetical protein
VSDWRPLFKRNDPEALAELAKPVEGLPPWLIEPVVHWIFDCVGGEYSPRPEAMRDLQVALRLTPPLPDFGMHGLSEIRRRIHIDAELGLEVVDYLLYHSFEMVRLTKRSVNAGALSAILRQGGSAWEVAEADEPGRFQLSKRAAGPVRETILELPADARATQHLTTAWNRLSGRKPDVSVAYREAIRAVEAAAKPVILPANSLATLGTMIAALRDKPEKWTTTLGSVETVRLMMEAVWKGQRDRHGTDDDSVPANVTAAEADAAVTTCITLVRLFVGGHVQAASPVAS